MRYRPTNQADLEAHAGMLALLAEDLADLPTDLLEYAIQRHCASSPYMPKAADLIRLAQDAQASASPATSLQDYAAELNAKSASIANDWHWFINQRRMDNGDTEQFLDRTSRSLIRWKTLPPSQRFNVEPRP